ncbi:MAG: nickel-dependent hydrogenase large subunit [Planctomycetota bacterium]
MIHLVWDIPYRAPKNPVCVDCRQRFIVCMFEKGELCLGPITKGGCRAPGPTAGLGCWGCRGPAADPNYEAFLAIARERGFSQSEPDFLALPTVLPLLEANPAAIDLARRRKGLGNRICDVVAGRTTHPVSLQVGGVAVMPDRRELAEIHAGLKRSLDDLDKAQALLATFEIPPFERETEFVSLPSDTEYPFIGGRLVSTDGVVRAEDDYLGMTNEYVDEHNTSKWCRLSRDSFAVGALARFNNNHAWLHPQAKEVAAKFGLTPVCHNPFMNNVAQLVECVHVAHDAIRLIDELCADLSLPTMVRVTPRAGDGVGAVEAPRGILYHHYVYDKEGRIEKADCVIPTTQNNANIHHDLRALAAECAVEGMTNDKLELLCSMLVRSYDPCVSCSVH